MSTPDCQYVTVSIAVSLRPGTDYWSATTDVTKGAGVVGSLFFGGSSDVKQDRHLYCPSQGYGKFTVGPSEWNSTVEGDWNYYSGIDTTSSAFYVRTKAKASISSLTRSNGYTIASIKGTRYDPTVYPSWVAYSVPKIVLQVKIGDVWKSVVAGEMRNGVATLRYKTSSKFSYRVWIPATESTLSAISPTVIK
ncbi:hypothetical protein [Microbacterium sp. KNMS]